MENKLTPHRQVVLDVVRANRNHPTAREVFEESSKLSPKLSFATVYNALKYLTDAGLLRLIRFGDEAVRYDPMTERHDHLICRNCGSIFDAMGIPAPSLPDGFRLPEGFEVQDITVQFQGTCGRCLGKAG